MKKIYFLIVGINLCTAAWAQKAQADSLARLLPAEKTDTGKIRKLMRIGRMLEFGMIKNDSALVYFQQAVDLSKAINEEVLEAEASFYLASGMYNSANYPLALVVSLQNIKRLEQLKSRNIQVEFNGDRNLLFYQSRLVSFIYSNIGDYKNQLAYIRRMQAIYYSNLVQKKDVSINYQLTIYFNLARAYENLTMHDSTLHYSALLYKEVSKKGDAQWLALAGDLLASYHEAHGNADTAMMLSRESILPALQSNRLDIVTGAELRMGKLFQQKGQKDSAFYYSLRALEAVLKMQNPKELLDTYKQVSELYKENAQPDSAYKYLYYYSSLKDSLQDLSKIAEAQNFAFNQSLTDQQVAQAKKETVQQLKNKGRLYALLAVILFILLATFLLMRNLRNKRKANILLTQQKEAIENSLATLKATQAQLIQAEKMASLGELTAGIAHEIQNPLNFVNNFSELSNELVDELKGERQKLKNERDELLESELLNDIAQNLEKINHHGKRADAIVKGMLQHSRKSEGQREPTDINALCDEYLRLSWHGLRAKDKSFNATLETDFDDSIGKINIIPQDMGRVVMNLLTNAFYAVNERKSTTDNRPLTTDAIYEPAVSIRTKKINNGVEIIVSDNGNGIPQNIIDKIFQPFFTTKPTGQG
ncbi:MAG: hypothetical protein EOO13_09620, partial [Chitinophagaceae bacterium]